MSSGFGNIPRPHFAVIAKRKIGISSVQILACFVPCAAAGQLLNEPAMAAPAAPSTISLTNSLRVVLLSAKLKKGFSFFQ
jgi:hypothetical protein